MKTRQESLPVSDDTLLWPFGWSKSLHPKHLHWLGQAKALASSAWEPSSSLCGNWPSDSALLPMTWQQRETSKQPHLALDDVATHTGSSWPSKNWRQMKCKNLEWNMVQVLGLWKWDVKCLLASSIILGHMTVKCPSCQMWFYITIDNLSDNLLQLCQCLTLTDSK